jgi:2-C-methyl-D-erythritol 4-phosphate cytidylyltransferase
VAIIPAAGKGLRLQSEIPKPYLALGKDKPLLAYTLEVFENCPDIDKVYVVVAQEQISRCEQEVIQRYRLRKVERLIVGGKLRQASVYNGLQALTEDTELVLVHDGARPLVSAQLISRCILKARKWGAAIAALPVFDTIKQVTPEGCIEQTISRDRLWAAQTPQVFTCRLLKQAFSKAIQDGFWGTDEASLVERLGHNIKIVKGEVYNIKITAPEDVFFAEAVLSIRK